MISKLLFLIFYHSVCIYVHTYMYKTKMKERDVWPLLLMHRLLSTLLLYRERWRWIIDGLSPARQEKAFWRNGTFPVVKKVCNLSIWTNKITWPLDQVTWPTVFKRFRQQNMKENDLCFFGGKSSWKLPSEKCRWFVFFWYLLV